MTTPHLADDITRDEGGLILKAYPDPLTKGPPWTCGAGCTGEDVGPHTVWTREYAIERRDHEITRIKAALDRELPWWRSLSDPRQDCLVNMAYNMGVAGFLGFHNTLEAVRTGEYARAAVGMLASKWSRQVGGRAKRLAEQMRTGVRA